MSSLAFDGLHRKTSVRDERIVGKDVETAVGLRVRIASRYASDNWARDETGGRCGTIMSVETGASKVGCTVRWDRADGRSWGPGRSLELVANYTGTYRCGSMGCYHLALAHDQLSIDHEAIVPAPTHHRSKTVQTASNTDSRLDFLFSTPSDGILEAMQVEQRRKEVEQKLETLGEQLRSQIGNIVDMCDDCLAEVDVALKATEVPSFKSTNDEDPEQTAAAAKLQSLIRAILSTQAYDEKLEEKKVGEEGKQVWALITATEEAYRKKVDADEVLYRALEDLNAYVEPSHVLFCSMAVPELSRKLEKIYGAGTPTYTGGVDSRAAGRERELKLPGGGARGILQQLQKSAPGSWATPLQLLQASPEDTPEAAAAALAGFRKDLKGVINQLQDGKYRSLTEGAKGRPALFKKFVENDGADADAMIQALEELLQRPEVIMSEIAKADITAVAETLKALLGPAKALAQFEDPENNNKPESVTAEGQKARREERKKIIDDIKAAFGKGAVKEGDKKDDTKDKKDKKDKPEDKKDDKKTGGSTTSGRAGPPLYDPEDEMGGVLMAEKVEQHFRDARELLQAMMLRSSEVENARMQKARKPHTFTHTHGIGTEGLGPSASEGNYRAKGAAGAASGGGDFRSKMQPKDFYDGRANFYELPPQDLPDSTLDDLARARSALNTASRLHDKVDLPKVMGKMEALGFPANDEKECDRWHLPRIKEVHERIHELDKDLCKVENDMIEKAREAVTRAECATLGEVRGEMLRDAGQAHRSITRAREVLAKAITSQQLRSDDALQREGLAVASMQNLARDQAARLLDESDNLVKLAQDKVEGWQTLDALLLFKSAQEKTSRADVTSQEMSAKFLPPLFLSRGDQKFEDYWWPGKPSTLAGAAAPGLIRHGTYLN